MPVNLLSDETSILVDSSGEQFQLIEILGEGAAGVVYKSRQVSLDRLVAVKLLKTSSSMTQAERLHYIERMKKEANALARLTHDNVVRVYRFGISQNDAPFLVLDLIEGQTLANLLRQKPTLESKETIRICKAILSALGTAHELGLVHRDIKPSNIILRNDGTPKLMDFGLVKDTAHKGQTQTADNAILGTAAYMSPEQCIGREADARSDLYSLALVVFECLTGMPLFNDTFFVMAQQKSETPDLAPYGLPPRWQSVLSKALRAAPEERFQTASEFSSALDDCDRLDANSLIPSRNTSRKKWKPQIYLFAASVLILIAGIAYQRLTGETKNERVYEPPETLDRTRERAAQLHNIYEGMPPHSRREAIEAMAARLKKQLLSNNNSGGTSASKAWAELGFLHSRFNPTLAISDLNQALHIHQRNQKELADVALRLEAGIVECEALAGLGDSRIEAHLKDIESRMQTGTLSPAGKSNFYLRAANIFLLLRNWDRALNMAEQSQFYSEKNSFRSSTTLSCLAIRAAAYQGKHEPTRAIAETENARHKISTFDSDNLRCSLLSLANIRKIRMEEFQLIGKAAESDREYKRLLEEAKAQFELRKPKSDSGRRDHDIEQENSIRLGLLRVAEATHGRMLMKRSDIGAALEHARIAATTAVKQKAWSDAEFQQFARALGELQTTPKNQKEQKYFDLTEDLTRVSFPI